MHSIKTKITGMTVSAIVLAMIIAALFSVFAVRDIGMRDSEQILRLLGEAGQKNLDSYFENVEQNVRTVSAYVEADLDGLEDERLQAHLDRVSSFFQKVMYRTSGVITYYYRIDPAVSSRVKGFWFVNIDGEGFREHEVTDITLYDTEDTTRLVWFTVPKATGEAVWLPPYITDNLDVRVISYNIPVYLDGQFVGVIGIELDYSVMVGQVDNITLYENGYAFVNDAQGNVVYHPHMDVLLMENQPVIPEGLVSADSLVRYRYEGREKLAVWLPLLNGDRLNVSVPVNEINAHWLRWVWAIVLSFAALLAAFVVVILRFTGRITKPLQDLTAMAEQIDKGNYDCTLDYTEEDEIGVLTRTFTRVTANLKNYITDLNDLAYADALTSLHNKGAFDICIENIQKKMVEHDHALEFAVCIFDCNDLKGVNDRNGHDKGDIYLRETAEIICEVYDHSPVFRIGGDEFAAVLLDRDYKDRERLLSLFDETCAARRMENADAWQQIDVARGMAVYNPKEDSSVNDVVRRADKIMYENKWKVKQQRLSGTAPAL